MTDAHDDLGVHSARLRDIVGELHVMGQVAARAYAAENPLPTPSVALAVRPGTVQEVRNVLSYANDVGLRVHTRGMGSALSGSSAPNGPSRLLLDMTRLSRVIDVNKRDHTITAECGVSMAELEQAAFGMQAYVHTVAIPANHTTLGGVLSGVCGGGLPYGVTMHGSSGRHVLGLKIVLADGTLVDTSASTATGIPFIRGGNAPDLTGLFLGDAGAYGVKVEATVQAYRQPNHGCEGRYGFQSRSSCWEALRSLTDDGDPPFRVMASSDPTSDRWVVTYVIIAQEPQALESASRKAEWRCETQGGVRVENSSAEGPADAASMTSRSPSLERDIVAMKRAAISFVARRAEAEELVASLVGALDDAIGRNTWSNLGLEKRIAVVPYMEQAFFVIMSVVYNADDPDSRRAALSLQELGLKKVASAGAALEAHHGDASRIAAGEWGDGFRDLHARLKSVLDPKGILNDDMWGRDSE